MNPRIAGRPTEVPSWNQSLPAPTAPQNNQNVSERDQDKMETGPRPGGPLAGGPAGNGLRAPDQKMVRLKYAHFDPRFGMPQKIIDLPDDLKKRDDSKLFILQFPGAPSDAQRAELEERGVELHRYVPDNAFVVRMDPGMERAIERLPFVRAVVSMPPAFKLEESLLGSLSGETESLVGTVKVNIVAVNKDDKASLQASIEEMGGTVTNPESGSILMVAELTQSQLMKVSQLDTVSWIDRFTEAEVDVDNARIQGGVDYIEHAVPGKFTGIGLRGHVLEGIEQGHQGFEANEHRDAPVIVDDGRPTSHGQQTYGIIYGSGKGNDKARGIIPNAQGYYTNYDAVINGTGKGPGSRYELTKRLIEKYRVMFQTASWGYSRTTEYNSRSAEMDDIIFDLDIPVTQSQSNAGTRASRPQAWAKNIISVGALRHQDNADPSDDNWSRGASIGPATDGRIKPDIAAYYDRILTTGLNNRYTTGFGGTSGATPIVNGFVGLVIEMWTDGVFGNELPAGPGNTPEIRFANRPHASTVKALLNVSNTQWEFEGADHDRTRVHQGWGFPDMKRLYDMREKMMVVNEDDLVSQGQTRTYTVNVEEGEPVLKASMVYADPTSAVSSEQTRVNDLDLKITAPDGTVYHGNHGLLENMFSTAGGSPDKNDTVENIFIQNPQAGEWKIEVTGAEINADSHVETAETDADFALAVMGATRAD